MKYGNTNIGGMSFGSTRIGGAKYGNTLVYQAGSPTPPAPTPVFYDHLVFDGTAYIETNYVLPSGGSLKCEKLGGETVKASQGLIMAQGSNGGFIAILYSGNTTSTTRSLFSFYDSSSSVKSTTLAFSTTNYTAFLTSKRLGINNTGGTFTKGSKHPDGGVSFGRSSTQPYSGVMGTVYVYGSDTANVTTYDGFASYEPVATFRPCTYNGEAGLWYVEGNTFFGNTAGSGSLLAEN